MRSPHDRIMSSPWSITETELGRLLDEGNDLAELPTWMERLAESVRERRSSARLMQQWLDQHE